MVLGHSSNDLGELRLKGGTTNKEAINIGLANEGSGVSGVSRSTILDANLVSNVRGNILDEPGANVGVGSLGDLGGGGLSSSNGPHGLVSNDYLAPVVDGVSNGVKLLLENLIGLLGFTLGEGLTNAEDGVEAVFLGELALSGDDLVGLTVEGATLGVTDESPLDFKIFDLLSADFSSEGSVFVGGNVLGGDLDLAVKHGLGGGNVNGDGSDNDLDTGFIVLHLVESFGAKVADEVNGTIALPVSTDNVFSGFTFLHLFNNYF